jgi:hypothetical protein
MILNLPKDSCGSVTSALKKLFSEMLSHQKRVSSLELVRSFNWDQELIHAQRDVLEFSKEFLEDLSTEIEQENGDTSFFKKFFGILKTTFNFTRSKSIENLDEFGEISITISKVHTVEEGIKKFTDGVKMIGGTNLFSLIIIKKMSQLHIHFQTFQKFFMFISIVFLLIGKLDNRKKLKKQYYVHRC